MEQHKVEVNAKDLYQMLIAEMRYGLSRNNHLEPWSAIRHARWYVQRLFDSDREWGIAALKQLAEECINALTFAPLDQSNEDLVYHFVKDAVERLEDEQAPSPYNIEQFTEIYLSKRKDH